MLAFLSPVLSMAKPLASGRNVKKEAEQRVAQHIFEVLHNEMPRLLDF